MNQQTIQPLAPAGTLRGRSILSSADLSPEEIELVLTSAMEWKRLGRTNEERRLAGQCLALVFEKPSNRTRVTFETAVVQLGGHPIYLTQADIGLGTRESVPDVARNLSRWVQGISARTFKHSTVTELAENATIPVINALSDQEHPCQALADFQTIMERAGSVRGFTLAWVGDGNNVCHSVMLTGARLGAHIRVAAPAGYHPDPTVVQQATADAEANGGSIRIVADAQEAVEGAGAIYADVWTSMGQEAEREDRLRIFRPYQVNSELLRAASPKAFVLHCLPAHRGEEITGEVLDGPQSAVLDQAENRLWAQKALLALLMG